jgi:hypothetical protein
MERKEGMSGGLLYRGGNFPKGPLLAAVLGAMTLMGSYFGILTLANSLGHAVDQFALMWPWFTALVAGFGVQTGLYTYIRRAQKTRHLSAMVSKKGITATGGVSTTAMAACCAHHLVDVLPIIGLTGAALFFSEYQKIFLLLGILANIVSITLMLHIMQRHGLMEKDHPLSEWVFKWNMGKIFRWNMGLSMALFAIVVMVRIFGQHFPSLF